MLSELSDIRSFLMQTPLFESVPDRGLHFATEAVRTRSYGPDAVIFREGDWGEALYILAKGLVKLSKVDLDGREKILAILKPGDFFGETAMLTHLSHSTTAVALTAASVYTLADHDFFKLIKTYPAFGLNLTSTLASRLASMYDESQILSYQDSQGRVIYVILRLYNSGFIEFSKDGRALIRLTHQDIASLAGTSRETVTRAFKALEIEGVIETKPRTVIVKDPVGLEEILHGVR